MQCCMPTDEIVDSNELIDKMFTNWLTSAATVAASTAVCMAPNAPPPDVILEVGPSPYSRFAAHSALLAAHSGYLRSAIRPDDRCLESPIYLPNITTEQFAPLLTYMYTGFLDLSVENIFGVLLATHVLHMPRALEICRGFLARIQPEGYLGSAGVGLFLAGSQMEKFEKYDRVNAVKVIRPIASKPTGTGVGFIAPPVSNTLLPSHDTPFKSLTVTNQENQRDRSPIPSTSKDTAKEAKKARTHKREKQKTRVSRPVSEISVASAPEQVASMEETPNKTIVDVASCDGPVRFHRVLNDAYGRVPAQSSTSTTGRSHERDVATSFHMQMARNISERQTVESAQSENNQEIVVDQPVTDNNNSTATTTSSAKDEVYSCVYCKHTFKSQYCYQKHAKRHLNPLSIDGGELVVDADSGGSEKEVTVADGCSKVIESSETAAKREVRPLDMNVQYYPCKTCGSKFPSYYFVHKHRKLCHVNEEN